MTDNEADELLRNNDWSKWSDARELLQEAAHIGALQERTKYISIVLRITTAYEQGVGHARRTELSNPYGKDTPEYEAWDLGREFGLRKPEPKISTEHGPWLPSLYHKYETYCERCLTRDIFRTNRKCDPHIVYEHT